MRLHSGGLWGQAYIWEWRIGELQVSILDHLWFFSEDKGAESLLSPRTSGMSLTRVGRAE